MVSLEVAIEMLAVAVENLAKIIEQQQHPQLVALSQTVEGQGDTPAAEAPPDPDDADIEAVSGEDSHVLELIALAKEMGYDYLYHEGNLAIDNRVLDEYNRRHLETNLEP